MIRQFCTVIGFSSTETHQSNIQLKQKKEHKKVLKSLKLLLVFLKILFYTLKIVGIQ